MTSNVPDNDFQLSKHPQKDLTNDSRLEVMAQTVIANEKVSSLSLDFAPTDGWDGAVRIPLAALTVYVDDLPVRSTDLRTDCGDKEEHLRNSTARALEYGANSC